ncbi:hypothetical protein THIOM_005612 [Candidatus Thiomargarita nelsonii]|uniref:Uncharacterized protein n=1 Tax=Candidatus Thiomargarita nelsonii TaxID=1003181 RepID=A0A176RSR8_9GAMM|nr:hypothetical protein THIOM_005612 [Candidatus Thiomargarita nelsonii]
MDEPTSELNRGCLFTRYYFSFPRGAKPASLLRKESNDQISSLSLPKARVPTPLSNTLFFEITISPLG